MQKRQRLMAVLAAICVTACGGGGGSPGTTSTPISGSNGTASSDAIVPLTTSIVPAIAGETFTYPLGVGDFGTNTTTTVSITSPGTSPPFAIKSGSSIATGNVSFAAGNACVFSVLQSTFTAPTPLVPNATINEQPCQLDVATKGEAADGQTRSTNVRWILGGNTSAATSMDVSINGSGQVTVNNQVVGTVTLTH